MIISSLSLTVWFIGLVPSSNSPSVGLIVNTVSNDNNICTYNISTRLVPQKPHIVQSTARKNHQQITELYISQSVAANGLRRFEFDHQKSARWTFLTAAHGHIWFSWPQITDFAWSPARMTANKATASFYGRLGVSQKSLHDTTKRGHSRTPIARAITPHTHGINLRQHHKSI